MAIIQRPSGSFDAADLATNYVVQQDPDTGVFEVGDVAIPAAIPIAWADFTLLDWTQYDGIYFRVSNVHSVGSTGGSLWVGDAAGDRPILIDQQIQVATLAIAYSSYPPATYPGLVVVPADVGAPMIAVGSEYLLVGGECVLSRSAVAKRAVSPAVTFTSAAVSDVGGKVTLTSAGAHGLTAAVLGASGNSYIYISAGTGWTAGLYPIHSIDSDTTGVVITLTTAFASQGVPTIALAGTEFVLQTVTVPRMTTNGFLGIDWTWGSTSGANTKTPGVRLGGIGGTVFYQPSAQAATTLCGRPLEIIIQNRGATNSQVNGYPSANAGGGANVSTTAATTGAVDTSVATDLVLTAKMTAANDPIWVERYVVRMGT